MTPHSFMRRLSQGLCVVVVGATVAGAAQAAVCVDARERDSLTVRSLQTRLMVAALTCGVRADYNAFVVRYRPQLTDHSRALRGYFNRAFGRSAQRALDGYVTDLANRASQLSIADRNAFCAHSAESLDALLTAAEREGDRVLTLTASRVPAISGRDPGPGCDALTRR